MGVMVDRCRMLCIRLFLSPIRNVRLIAQLFAVQHLNFQ